MIVENIISGNVIITFLGMIFSTITQSGNVIFILYSLFVFVKGRHFPFFTNLLNSKLISELVSSDKTVFLCNNATQV